MGVLSIRTDRRAGGGGYILHLLVLLMIRNNDEKAFPISDGRIEASIAGHTPLVFSERVFLAMPSGLSMLKKPSTLALPNSFKSRNLEGKEDNSHFFAFKGNNGLGVNTHKHTHTKRCSLATACFFYFTKALEGCAY